MILIARHTEIYADHASKDRYYSGLLEEKYRYIFSLFMT